MNKYSTLYITALGLISCTGGNKPAEASATAAANCDTNKQRPNIKNGYTQYSHLINR